MGMDGVLVHALDYKASLRLQVIECTLLHLHQCWETGGVSVQYELRIIAYKHRSFHRGSAFGLPAHRIVREG